MSKRTEMKEKVPMAKKHMKKYSLSLATKEMQIKAILHCYYPLPQRKCKSKLF
jgi:hypothetical protein